MTPRLLLSLFAANSLALTACDAAISAQQQAEAPAEANVQADVVVQAEAVGEVQAVAVQADDGAKAEAKVTVELKPEALDLETVTYLVKKGKVKDAGALEKKINSPKEKINNVDIDGDGKVDKIVIVEVKKDDGTIIFELHAIPSKSKDKDAAVVIAFITFVPDKATGVLVVKATYAPVVIGYDTIVFDYTVPIVVKNDKIVVSGGVGFYGWLFLVHRPVYYGVVIYDYDPPPVIIVHHDGCWPPGHCKHHWKGGKHKWKGKGKGHWH